MAKILGYIPLLKTTSLLFMHEEIIVNEILKEKLQAKTHKVMQLCHFTSRFPLYETDFIYNKLYSMYTQVLQTILKISSLSNIKTNSAEITRKVKHTGASF